MSRVDRTAQHLIGIANQEPCSAFEKTSNTLVQSKRTAKIRRRISLGTLLLCLFQECKLGRDLLEETQKETTGKESDGELRTLLWCAWGAQEATCQLPALRQGLQLCVLLLGSWVIGAQAPREF